MKNNLKKKIIITGAAGEVGLNLAKIIDERRLYNKYNFMFIDRNLNNLNVLRELFPWADSYCYDLAKKDGWQKLFSGADTVITLHTQIASTKKKDYSDNNVASVKNVLDECKKNKIKNLVHISSSVVISIAKDNYSSTKKSGEEIVHKSKVPHTILRPTLMYGCFDIKHTGYLVKLVDYFPIFPMPGSGKYIRQPLYVEDFCNIILKCIEMKPKNTIYNITGKEKIYLQDMMKTFFKERKMKRWIINIPLPIFYFLIKFYQVINPRTKIVTDQLTALTAGDIFPVIAWEKIFSVKPTKFSEGVKKTVKSKYYPLYKQMK